MPGQNIWRTLYTDSYLEVDWQSVSEDRFNKNTESFDMDPSHEAFTEIDFEPTNQGAKLAFFVSRQFRHFILAGLKLFRVINEISNNKFIFTGLKIFKIVQYYAYRTLAKISIGSKISMSRK